MNGICTCLVDNSDVSEALYAIQTMLEAKKMEKRRHLSCTFTSLGAEVGWAPRLDRNTV